MFGIGPKIFAVLIALTIGVVASSVIVVGVRAVATTIKQARDADWLIKLNKANSDAQDAKHAADTRAAEAAEAVRKQIAAEQSETDATERAAALQRLIGELAENPVCIPHDIVKELRR